MGFYNYIGGPNPRGGPNPLADWVPRGSIFASGFGPGGPNLGGSKSARTPGFSLNYKLGRIGISFTL